MKLRARLQRVAEELVAPVLLYAGVPPTRAGDASTSGVSEQAGAPAPATLAAALTRGFGSTAVALAQAQDVVAR